MAPQVQQSGQTWFEVFACGNILKKIFKENSVFLQTEYILFIWVEVNE